MYLFVMIFLVEVLNNKQVFCEEGALEKLAGILQGNNCSKPFLVVFEPAGHITCNSRLVINVLLVEAFKVSR